MNDRLTIPCCLVVFACLAACIPATAQELTTVSGVLQGVDLEVGTITIRPKGKESDDVLSLLRKDVEVTSPNGQKGTLASLFPGHTVVLKLGVAGDVLAVAVQSPVLIASVLSVDPPNRTFTIVGPGDRNTTMPVDPDAKIRLGERPAYLREIKPGSKMSVTVSLDGRKALAMELLSDPDGRLSSKLFLRFKTSRLPGNRNVGVIVAVDPAKNELQFTGATTKFQPRVMTLKDDAEVRVVFGQVPLQTLKLDQIPKMTPATVMTAADDQKLTHIVAEPPTVRGTVKALDPVRGMLTVRMESETKTFSLPSSLKVMYGSRVWRLPDVRLNEDVNLVMTLDRKELLAISLK